MSEIAKNWLRRLAHSPLKKTALWCGFALLFGLAVYLVMVHYVMAYSDPVSWLHRGRAMMQGLPVTSRPPLFPFFCGVMMKLVGPVWVFLANLPVLLIMITLVGVSAAGLVSTRADGSQGGGIPRELVAFASVCLLVFFNLRLFSALVNPYREALAFALLFGGILLLFRTLDTKRSWQALAAGVLVGLAIGGRETCVLMLPGMGLLYVHALVTRKNEFPYIKVALCFGAGLIVGSLPMMIQNALHTGMFWLPSYARGRVVSGSGELYIPNDIPVPGMFIGKFFETGSRTLTFFREKYAWWGLCLLAVGLVVSVRRRYTRVWLLSVPSIAISILFYSFYWYVKGRYLFIVDLFTVPIMAIGLVALLSCLYGLLPAVRKKTKNRQLAFNVTALLMLFLTFLFLTVSIFRKGSERLQVWDVPALREAIDPVLKKPYVFASSRRHYRSMLGWLLRAEQRIVGGQRIRISDVVESGLEAKLADIGKETLASLPGENIYYYGDGHPLLLKSWCEFEEVMSLADLPVPLDHYSRRMTEGLYELKPWSRTNVTTTVTCGVGSQHLLLLDGYRLWDYPGRSFCDLYLNGEKIDYRVSNNVNLVTFETPGPEAQAVEVRLVSDAPLPVAPPARSVCIDQDLVLNLGAVPEFWCYPLLSREIRVTGRMKTGACLMMDKGTITLPHFASTNRMVFALLRTEFYQEDHFFRELEHMLTCRIGDTVQRYALPKKGYARWSVIKLGRGTGRLAMVPVKMSTPLPTYKEQLRLRDEKKIATYGFVKFATVHIVSMPSTITDHLHIDIGADEDALFLLDGFCAPERFAGGGMVRWTSGRGVVRIPPPAKVADYDVRIIVRNARPEKLRAAPTFRFNGTGVVDAALRERALSDERTEYSLRIDRKAILSEDDSILEIVSSPWVPSEVLSTTDHRKLGHMIDSIDIECKP